MSAAHQREIQHLERRLAELKRLAADAREPAVGAMRPSRERGERSSASPPGKTSDEPPEAEPAAAPPPPKAKPARGTKVAKKKTLSPEDVKRMERAVLGLVVVFFGSCVALAAVEKDGAATKRGAPAAAPEAQEEGDPGERPRVVNEPSRWRGPSPMAMCERLVKAGAALACESKGSLQEGVRLAEFTMGHSAQEKGVVRTFDTVARCESSSSGVLSGGTRFARCDLRTAVLLATGATAEDTSAARRVMTSL